MRVINVRPLIWCVLALLLGSYGGALVSRGNLGVDSNILSLLPATEADPAVEQAFANFSERSMRTLVFLVAGADLAGAKRHAAALEQALLASPWIKTVTLERGADQQANIAGFHYQYRHRLLAPADAALLEAGEYQVFADDVIRQAYAPISGGLVDLMQRDPFLLSWRAANAARGATATQLTPDGAYLTATRAAEHFVLLTAELNGSPFDQMLQQDVLGTLAAVENAAPDDVRLLRTGALFYTAFAYATASREISLFGGSSLVLILLLLLVAFRSVRPLVLVGVALGFGIASGFAVTRLLFGEVHLMTIVFGASLIGVAVDYAFHYFVIDDEPTGEARLARIFPALSLGLLTSAIGYAALFSTPFPGLRQMALFCISGLTGAWLTVVLLFPALALAQRTSPQLLALCRRFGALGGKHPGRVLLILVLLLPPAAASQWFSGPRALDDVRNFQTLDPALLAEEARVQEVLDGPEANQFVLVQGATQELLLQNIEAAHTALDALLAQGALTSYQSIATWLPSVRRQERNHMLYGGLYASAAAQALVDAGLVTEVQLALARTEHADAANEPVLPETFLRSALGAELAWLWLDMQTGPAGDGPALAGVIALQGLATPALLRNLATATDGSAVFVDKIATVNAMLADYRSNVTLLLGCACVAIFCLLLFRYRLWRAAVIMASPLIAISATLLGLNLLGEAPGLFNIMALFLVVGVGVDSGIFFAEAERPQPGTLLAIVLATLTTMFSFGMLALSATTVIHSFGLSMLIGISSVLVLAPLVGRLVGNHAGSVS